MTKIKQIVYSVLTSKLNGLFKAELSNEKELIELIKKLHPKNIGIDLIRIGGNSDGGYLLPNDLTGITKVFSPGIGPSSKFEYVLAEEYNMDVFLADASVSGPMENSKKFTFYKKFIGSNNSDTFITLTDLIKKSGCENEKDMLLQMDIEGYEYEVLLNTNEELLNNFRIIVIEFHYLDLLFTKFNFNLMSSTFNKLLKNHTCVHIHPNNCCEVVVKNGISIPPAMEFTFIRNDRIKNIKNIDLMPNELDYDCLAHQKSIVLPSIWFK